MSDRTHQPERHTQLSERERAKIQDRFGTLLVLLLISVFFSIAAPTEAWAWMTIVVMFALTLSIAMWASGARPGVVRAWLVIAGLDIGASVFIAVTQASVYTSGYLALTALLLALATIGAVARRLWLHPEISLITVLGAVSIYVLLGVSFSLLFTVVGTLGPQSFFASQEGGTRSDYLYFSFITLSTVGYGDLTPKGGLGRALAVMEGLLGQIYLVTAVAAIVGNLGRTR